MKKYKTIFDIFIKFFVLLIFFSSCNKNNTNNKNGTTRTENNSDYIISATELYNEFKKNPIDAEKKYNNKTIEVTGEILNVFTDKFKIFKGDQNVVDLRVNQNSRVHAIRFIFLENQISAITSLDDNNLVTISGKFKSFDRSRVTLLDSKISKYEKKKVSNNNYDYEMDAKKFCESVLYGVELDKYVNKVIKISGIFSEIYRINENSVSITLFVKAERRFEESDRYVFCDFDKEYSDKLNSLKKNDKITIIGKCKDDSFNATLIDCIFP